MPRRARGGARTADGTSEACCAPGRACVDGACKADCPGGRLTAAGVCCDSPEQVCRLREGAGEFWCGAGKTCCRAEDGEGDVCCAPDRCLAPGLCCAVGAELKCPTTRPHCAPPTHECCGEYSCPAGWGCIC